MRKIAFYLVDKLVEHKLCEYFTSIFNNVDNFDGYINDKDILVVEKSLITDYILNSKGTIIILLDNVSTHNNVGDTYYKELDIQYMPIDIRKLEDTIMSCIYRNDNLIEVAGLLLDLNKGYFYNQLSDTKIEVAEKEGLILKQLLLEYPEAISKENFLNKVWGIQNTGVQTQSLESYISLLRKKLLDKELNISIEKTPQGFRLII